MKPAPAVSVATRQTDGGHDDGEATGGVLVVTGGSRGIGAAITRRLARWPGCSVVVAYRSDERVARGLVDELTNKGARITAMRCDVADEASVEALFRAVDGLGPLAGLVTSAGILHKQAPLTAIEAARWREVLAVNVIGTAMCCREAVRRMRTHELGPRSIVTVSSRAAVLGSPHEYVDYASSKAAVDTLTRGLALEVAGDGIRVNTVRPGIVHTDMHASGGEPGRASRLGPSQPLGRAGQPDEVAAAVEWLLSEEASFVTGTYLDVSGGR